jgi:broad specificity phosphatase PhoE
LRRAVETASFLPEDVERRVVAELIEVGQGSWEGLRWDEIEARDPALARERLERWLEIAAPGGESWKETLERARAVVEMIRAGPRPAIVVAHQGINSALAHVIAGVDPLAFAQAYCEVIEYEL